MRSWQFWWNSLLLASEYDPPRFVELMMLMLAMAMLGLWGLTDRWPYLGLSLSYLVGSSTSILVRERRAPTAYTRWKQGMALLALIVSFYFFADYLMGFRLLYHF